jgi:hypothetical protein
MTPTMRTLSLTRSAVELLQRVFAPIDRPASDRLQWDYSCATDVLSAWIGQPQPCDKIAVDDHVVIRISRQTHRVVGIDVFAASERSGKWPGALNGAMARRLLEEHGPAALAMWRAQHGEIAPRT